MYSAFAPGLKIIHRPGRVHSNVDPLSCVPRAPPDHVSPIHLEGPAILLDIAKAEASERLLDKAPAARAALHVDSLYPWLEGSAMATVGVRWSERITTRKSDSQEKREMRLPTVEEDTQETEESQYHLTSRDPYEAKKLWEATHQPLNLLVEMEEALVKEFVEGYQRDPVFKNRWEDPTSDADSWSAARRFFKDDKRLLFFRDADFHARLCVPKAVRNTTMR